MRVVSTRTLAANGGGRSEWGSPHKHRASMPPSKKSKKTQEVPQEAEDNFSESEDEEQPLFKVRKSVEEAEEAPTGEGDKERVRRLKRSRVNERRKSKQNGYRSFAEAAGATHSFGNDMLFGILSQSDIKRLATWCPSAGEAGTKLAQFETHLALRDEPLTSGPIAILHANVEAFARKVATELVLRNVETGSAERISAANVRSVLRPLGDVFESEDFMLPNGVVRAAQSTHLLRTVIADDGSKTSVECQEPVLPRSEEEEGAIGEERKFAKSNQVKLLKETDKARAAALEVRCKARAAAKSAKKAEKVASATATA